MIKRTSVEIRAKQSLNRTRAKAMRREPPDAERKFWYLVRDRRLGGYKFKRQVLIGSYIVDFVCLERAVIVELDGGQHAAQHVYDEIRDDFLRAKGFRVLRFWNVDVLTNTPFVLETVSAALAASTAKLSLSPSGERVRVRGLLKRATP